MSEGYGDQGGGQPPDEGQPPQGETPQQQSAYQPPSEPPAYQPPSARPGESPTASTAGDASYPVRLNMEYPERVSRLLNNIPYVKMLLLIPHLLILIALMFVALAIGIVAWFAILFTGRYPRGLFDFIVNFQRWNLNVSAYLYMLRDDYPPFSGEAGQYAPVSFGIDYPDRLSRLLNNVPYVKTILVLPHIAVLILLILANLVVYYIAWFAILFTGRYPQGMFNFTVGVFRWSSRVNAYTAMLTDKYPPFSLT